MAEMKLAATVRNAMLQCYDWINQHTITLPFEATFTVTFMSCVCHDEVSDSITTTSLEEAIRSGHKATTHLGYYVALLGSACRVKNSRVYR